MANDKRKVVRYTGPLSKQRGDIQYWDGNNWVSLQIGTTGEVLTGQGIGVPPIWNSLIPVISSSSSSSSSSAIASSSSSAVQPIGPEGLLAPTTQTTPNISKKTGSGTSDAHLTLGGNIASVTTHDRSGNEYESVGSPFNASWNYEDNAHSGSSTPVVYFGMRDPQSQKQTCISYDQDRLTTSLGYCITGVNVDSRNWAGSDSGSVVIAENSLGDYNGNILSITSHSIYGGEFKLAIVGNNLTLKDQSDVDIIAPTTLAIVPVPDSNPIQWVYPKIKVSLPNVKFQIEADFPMGDISTHIYRIILGSNQVGSEIGKYWAESLNLCALNPTLYPDGGVGGLFFKNLERCVDYDTPGNGIVYDPNEPGYESQINLRVKQYTPSSSSAAKIGVWGWYDEVEKEGLYSSSSSGVLVPVVPPVLPVGAHFLPINFNPPTATENIDNYIGSGKRASYAYTGNPVTDLDGILEVYGGSDLQLTQYKFNLMIIILDLLLNNTGYWELDGWCDDTIQIDGERVCCANGKVAPAMRVTISGLNWTLDASSSSSSRALTIDWCGETWTPEEDGKTKEICPVGFGKGRDTFSFFDTKSYDAGNIWQFNNSLFLWRHFLKINNSPTWSPTPYIVTNLRHILKLNTPGTVGGTDNRWIKEFPGTIPTWTVSSTLSLGVLSSGSALPSWSNYSITDDFFGSYTNPDGITFAWDRSPNWDAVVDQYIRENQ